METVRIVLGEAEFRDLVAGRVAKAKVAYRYPARLLHIELALSDIGWFAMTKAIHDAMETVSKQRPG